MKPVSSGDEGDSPVGGHDVSCRAFPRARRTEGSAAFYDLLIDAVAARSSGRLSSLAPEPSELGWIPEGETLRLRLKDVISAQLAFRAEPRASTQGRGPAICGRYPYCALCTHMSKISLFEDLVDAPALRWSRPRAAESRHGGNSQAQGGESHTGRNGSTRIGVTPADGYRPDWQPLS